MLKKGPENSLEIHSSVYPFMCQPADCSKIGFDFDDFKKKIDGSNNIELGRDCNFVTHEYFLSSFYRIVRLSLWVSNV